ncbi:hypothetical protein U1Q18_025673 [Sarracenia purpurea var. burkii]
MDDPSLIKNPMIRVSSPTPGLRGTTGVFGSVRVPLRGSYDYRSMDNVSTKGVSPSRISQLGDEDLEGSPMDNFCNVAQGAISQDKRGVSPLSSGRQAAINAM